VGSVLEFEGQYTEQFERCLKALTARFKENFEPDWTLPDGGGPIEVDPTVLEALPLWTRIETVRAERAGGPCRPPRRSGVARRRRAGAP